MYTQLYMCVPCMYTQAVTAYRGYHVMKVFQLSYLLILCPAA